MQLYNIIVYSSKMTAEFSDELLHGEISFSSPRQTVTQVLKFVLSLRLVVLSTELKSVSSSLSSLVS